MPRGGTRDGAGRPASGKKRLVVHVSDEERKAIIQLIESMRRTEKEKQALQV